MTIKRTTFVLAFLFLGLQFGFAQKTLSLSNDSKIQINGTSTLHDWESNVTEMSGTSTINANGDVTDISKLNFKLKVESIKSGKSKMDNYTYEALKSEDHPYISFALKDIKNIGSGKVSANGAVTIAGVTKTIAVSGTYDYSGGKLVISGNKDINMKDFNIEPPAVMFGTIVVGEMVNIEYNLILN